MSIEAMQAALSCDRVTGAAKLVLVGLANHDGPGGCFPGIRTLADYAGVSPRRVQQVLADLQAKGLVDVAVNAGGTTGARADRRPNRYTLHLDGVKPVSPRADAAAQNLHGVKSGAARGETQRARGVKPTSPEPSREPSREPSEEKHIELRSTACDHSSLLQEQSTVSRGNGGLLSNDEGRDYANAVWYAELQRLESASEIPQLESPRRAGIANMALEHGVEIDAFVVACREARAVTHGAAEFERELRSALGIDESEYWRQEQYRRAERDSA